MNAPVRPLISVVTPSFNQGSFIERCIRSVLEQGYDNFEHIIQDNCSTDDTAAVVARYPHVTFIREPDAGQSDALNRALRRARGEIIAWLNTDDAYEPGVFDLVARELHAETGVNVFAGGVHLTRPDGRVFQTVLPHFEGIDYVIEFWAHPYGLCQPGVFFRREVLDRVGLLDPTLHYAMPYDLWLRIAEHDDIKTTDRVLASYVVHEQSKTGASRCGAGFVEEWEQISRKYWGPRWSRIRRRRARECNRYVAEMLLHRLLDMHAAGQPLDPRVIARLLVRRPTTLFNRWFVSMMAERLIGSRRRRALKHTASGGTA